MKKIVLMIMAFVVSTSVMVGCGKENANNQNTNKKYIIATDAKYAPFSFEKDNKYVGIDVEIFDAIAKVENIQYELKPMDFKGIVPGMQSNQIDGAIAGISMTDDRKKILDFSEGYIEAGISAVVKDTNSSINNIDDIKGKVWAIKKGTAGSKFAEENKDKYGATIKYFDDTPSMFQEIVNGGSEVTFEDYPVISYKLKVDSKSNLKIVGDKVVKVDYGFAVKKGENKELLSKFNEGLKKIKENGEYDKIVSNYIKK